MTLQFKAGDEITIARGKYRNQTALVVEASESPAQYAAKLADGTLTIVNAVNVRQPQEVSISAHDLADVLSVYAGGIPSEVFESLEAKVPGITAHVRLVQA